MTQFVLRFIKAEIKLITDKKCGISDFYTKFLKDFRKRFEMECSKEFDDYREILRTETEKTVYKKLIELAVSKKIKFFKYGFISNGFRCCWLIFNCTNRQ